MQGLPRLTKSQRKLHLLLGSLPLLPRLSMSLQRLRPSHMDKESLTRLYMMQSKIV